MRGVAFLVTIFSPYLIDVEKAARDVSEEIRACDRLLHRSRGSHCSVFIHLYFSGCQFVARAMPTFPFMSPLLETILI